VRRLPEKQAHDRAALDQVLDAALVAHVGLVGADGAPYVLPMACARDGDVLLLHGSTGSRLLRALADGTPLCATVTRLDGLVLARSAFESSMHYRSAMVLGRGRALGGEEKERALDVLVDHLMPGRRAELRRSTAKELAATLVLAVPLAEWSVKVSDGPPEDDPADLDAPVWAGTVPLRPAYGEPVPAPDLSPGTEVPGYVREWGAP
jgi:nitroimidazol reductase NimA-like FMN-containing flavoprotein (pyridoxamine 5'-phosphate oxidase superfamily)